ncbi:MAG TPA: PQQ-binding-like beta-propeller repeat protein, partial [Polyangium sp.]|nr:PQQ-binding-like beta-propeller repeat protein [Polyangium sp.]
MRRTVFLAALFITACGSQSEVKKTVQRPTTAVSIEHDKGQLDPHAKDRKLRKLNEAPNGDVANIVIPGNRIEITDKSKGKRTLDSDILHPPPGEKGLIGVSAQTTTFLDDGSLLVGVGDGTLVSLDTHDKPRWSIGFRGAITGIVPANDDRVIVTTQRGVIASVHGMTGQVFWEKHLVTGALTPAVLGHDDHIYVAGPLGILAFTEEGALVFSHAVTLSEDICCSRDSNDAFTVDASGHVTGQGIDIRVSDPHPAIDDAIPTYVVDYEKVLDEKVVSVISAGPDELWLLVRTKKGSELVRYGKDATKRFAIPSRTAKAERMSEDEKLEKVPLDIDDIFLGPRGNPWIVGRMIFPVGEGIAPWFTRPAKAIILELNGATVRERNDLEKAFDENWVTTSYESRIRGPEMGNLHLLCFGSESNACALLDGAQPEILSRQHKTIAVSTIGKTTYVVSDVGPVEKLVGRQLVPIQSPNDDRYGTAGIGGTGDNDLWFTTAGHVAYHWDGKTFTATSVPQDIEGGVIGISPTDAWSRDGRMHWDGKRWSIVAEAQGAAGMVVRGPNDLWVGNYKGLFHSKPSTRTVVRWPAAKLADTKPLETPKTLTIGAPLQGYLASKTSLVIKNAPPVSTAKRVEVARDGTVWIEAWDKLVEIDSEGKTTVLDTEEQRIAFDRWFYPESPGRGIFTHRDRESELYNDRDEIRRFEGGKSTASTI